MTTKNLEFLFKQDPPGPAVREYFKAEQSRLDDRFINKEPVQTLVAARSTYIDQVLIQAWQHFNLTQYRNIALIAVGGYGRGFLHPFSDIDVLILLDQKETDELKTAVGDFITFLWDTGLDVGHAVRSIKECVIKAKEDITIATSIMEARSITGNTTLASKLKSLTSPEHMWSSKDFFAAKRYEQKQRYKKHNTTEYNLEPDVKNAPGGLRDIQTIGWVAKRHFDVDTMEKLVEKGFMTKKEFSLIISSRNFLWALRYALHMLHGRAENRLVFDAQKTIAGIFSYEDNESKLAVEQLMARYYRNALVISQFNEMLLQLFDEAILQDASKTSIEPLNERFQIRNGYIETTHPDVFKNQPSALLEIFSIIAHQENLQGIRAATIRQILSHGNLIDENFSTKPENQQLFLEILNSPYHLYTQLRRMKQFGVLGKYIPEFDNIIGVMQYDLFHRYTVDDHTLRVVKNMRKFRYEGQREKFPLACQIYKTLEDKKLLFLAGLFHDIAKGRGGNHSVLGAKDAFNFSRKHGYSKRDANMVAWLVEQHLIMSMTAQKKDLSDPEVIMDFAYIVGNQQRLDYLYCLTVADINATNKELWNGWRASLLRQLYTETKRMLRKGMEPVDKTDWIIETKLTAMAILQANQFEEKDISELWLNFKEDYFLRETPADIAWQTQAILTEAKTSNEPLILIKESTTHQFEGGTQIFIYTQNQPNLFAAIAATMDKLELTIVDARIMTAGSEHSLNTYIVLDDSGSPIENDSGRIDNIRQQLIETLSKPDQFPSLVKRILPRQKRLFSFPTDINISNTNDNSHTVVEITTLDQPGLLAKIGLAFMEFNVMLHNAKITTLGEKAEDVFFITDKNNNALTDVVLCHNIAERIKEILDQEHEDLKEISI